MNSERELFVDLELDAYEPEPLGLVTFVAIISSGRANKDGAFDMMGEKPHLCEELSHPSVLDFQGYKAAPSVPVRLEHQARYLAGLALEVSVMHNRLIAFGCINGDSPAGRFLVKSYQAGVHWRPSIGVPFIGSTVEHVKEGCVSVNGRQFDGPITVDRTWRLAEISLVRRPADQETCFVLGLPSAQPASEETTSHQPADEALCLVRG